MKIRLGFVSNSSSASFILSLKDISAQQLVQFNEILKNLESEEWSLNTDSETLRGWTVIDNDELSDKCREHNIPININPD